MRVRYLTTKQLAKELALVEHEVESNRYSFVLIASAVDLLEQLRAGESTAQQVADEWVRENERWNRIIMRVGPFAPLRLPRRRPRPILIQDGIPA